MDASTSNATTSNASEHGHIPVMRDRIAELLAPALEKEDAVLMDATLGAGGHSEYLLHTFPTVRILGVDRDARALSEARERLSVFGDRFHAIQCRFDEAHETLKEESHPLAEIVLDQGLAGSLFDLGVSSMQLDQVERGFAYRTDAPLDMRMDPTKGITAADVLNTYSHGDLARVLKTYGDERFAGKIASAVLKEREKEPFSTSARLVELLYDTIPAATRRTGGHPAKRTFQALRVEVNRELEAIELALPNTAAMTRCGGRMVVMSYQSLEDRLVKKFFGQLCASKTPPGLPVDLPGTAPEWVAITRGAEKASAAEIEENPRAAPVRVRAIERTSASTDTSQNDPKKAFRDEGHHG